MKGKKMDLEKKWTLAGIPILFVVSSMMHFIYGWTGDNDFVGLFAPVNESVWEHMKLIILPIMIWWSLYCMIGGIRNQLTYNKWFTGGLAALLVAMILMPLLFYFYTEAFGIELLGIDIFIVLIIVIAGQLLGLHVYRQTRGIPAPIVIIIFAVILIVCICWTYAPPKLPIFMDGPTGTYGII